MKRFVSLMLAVCFISLLFGCAGQQNMDTKPIDTKRYEEATIIEGKTTKAEIITALGMPSQLEGAISNADKAEIPSGMKGSFDGLLSSVGGGYFSYTYFNPSVRAQQITKAKITLVQKDGTQFSTNLGGHGEYTSLFIYFDNKGIVSMVNLTGKNPL